MRLMKMATLAAVAAMVTASGGFAHADVITWASSVDLIAGGDNSNFISQDGTFVVGFNGGNTSVTTVIGDSTFTAATDVLINAGITAGGVTVSTNNNGDTGPGTYQGSTEFATSSDVVALLNSGVFGTDTANGVIPTLTMSGLDDGQKYQIQLLINDARTGGPGGGRDTLWEVGVTDGDTNTTLTAVADLQNNPFNDQSPGQFAGDYLIGTFTGDSTGIQSFQFAGTRSGFTLGQAYANPNGGQAQINAFQLRAVPEPTTGSLLLGGMLMGLVKRRRK